MSRTSLKKNCNMIDNLKHLIVMAVSCLISMFSPIDDVLLGMVVLLCVNGAFGLVADIIQGDGWHTKKALSFLTQCFVYFGLVMSLFVVGHLIHKHDEAVTCVSIISIITTWVFTVNILRNGKLCTPEGSPMHRLFDILHYIASVQVVERIPYVSDFMRREAERKEVS